MPRLAALISISLVAAFTSCTSHQPEPEQVEREPTEDMPAVSPPVVQAPPVIEKAPEVPPSPTETPIVPVPATTQWRELPGMESIVGFHPFVYGVLAICGPEQLDDICKLRDDDTLEPSPVDFPERDPLAGHDRADDHVMTGNWRSDAWMVTSEATGVTVEEDERGDVSYDQMLVLRKLRSDTWFPSPIGENKRVKDTSQLVRKGWAGGVLVYDRPKFIRVPAASEPPAPTLGAVRSDQVFDFFEAASGRLYTVVVADDETMFVQRPCTSSECVVANAVPLPGGDWDFRVDVPRGDDSITVIVNHRGREPADYLLHFDAETAGGRWVLDRWPASEGRPPPTMLWPDTKTGLWAQAGDALWYRDVKGEWFDVALPFEVEAGDVIQFANRMKPREFLVLLVRGGVGRVFATKGPLRTP